MPKGRGCGTGKGLWPGCMAFQIIVYENFEFYLIHNDVKKKVKSSALLVQKGSFKKVETG